jgi:hypothetical protein
MTRRERLLLAALVAGALLLRLAMGGVLPAFQAPDERAHVHYVEYLLEEARLPVQPEHDLTRALRRWDQYYQPPLAYLLYLPLQALARAVDATPEQSVRALRAQNAIYGAATVAVGYRVVALLTPPGDPRRALVGIVLAFLPGFAASGSVVNNDGLANLLAALLWLPLLGRTDRARTPWLLGVAFGAACLAKLTVLALAPALLLAALRRRRGEARRVLQQFALAGAVAAALISPWLLRNALVYGDPLAIGAGSIPFEWLATLLPAEALEGAARPDPLKAFLQFWGRFGSFNNLSWSAIPALWITLAAGALAGWLRPPLRRDGDALEREAPGFAAALLFAGAGLASFSLRYYGGWQGRYLYTALLPAAALLAAGWRHLLPRQRQAVFVSLLALVLLALDAGLLWKLQTFFSTVDPKAWGLRHAL